MAKNNYERKVLYRKGDYTIMEQRYHSELFNEVRVTYELYKGLTWKRTFNAFSTAKCYLKGL